jgi:hypothetical protein
MEPDELPGAPLRRLAAPYARDKGYTPYRPRPGSKNAKLLADAQAVLRRYADHLPIGPRAIAYQLLPKWVPSEYPNKEKLRKALTAVLTRAGRARLISFDAIDDERTARLEPWTVEDLPPVVDQMQGDRQAGQPYRIEVVIEARGNLSRVGILCEPYGIPVWSGSGSVPVKETRRAGRRVARAAKDGQPTLFLVIVDFDPEGVKNIAQALADDVATFADQFRAKPDSLVIRQLALTEEQALALPEEAREELSSAPADWPQDFKVEVEALPPDQLDALVEAALAQVRDQDALDAAMAAEPEQRLEAVRALLDRLEYGELDDEDDDELDDDEDDE